MGIRIVVCTLLLVMSEYAFSQEKSGKSGGGNSSVGGHKRRAISQRHHFKGSERVSTDGNGTSTHRGKYMSSSKRENQGFAIKGSLFKTKKENQGFASNTYRTRKNKKKGVY